MKLHLTRIALWSSLLLPALPITALAGGKHAGGHEHTNHGAAHSSETTPYGQPGKASLVSRTVTINMDDSMRYQPATLQVAQGETLRLIVQNNGKLKHELSLGTEQELLEHLEEMKKFPDMEHDEPNKITLAPGKSGEIIWQFSEAGTVHFACLMPGHYEAGMKGTVAVEDRATLGEVRKIDNLNGKITLRHAAIKHLDMPPMTMVFTVKDKEMLNPLKSGDTVRFVVTYEANKYVITHLQKAQ